VGDAPGAPVRESRTSGLIRPGHRASVSHPGHTRSRTQITPFRGCTGGHADDRIAAELGGSVRVIRLPSIT